MRTGMVFDIEEFAVHAGPGIRATGFLFDAIVNPGSPLRCPRSPDSRFIDKIRLISEGRALAKIK